MTVKMRLISYKHWMDMAQRLPGREGAEWYWHVHHEILLEWCWDPRERGVYIVENKKAWEVPIRMRRMKPVRNLPEFLKGRMSTHRMTRWQQEELFKLHRKQCPNCPFRKNLTRVKSIKGIYFLLGDLFHGLRNSFDDIPRHIINVGWK